MYTVMISGGIASGKSYAADYLSAKYNTALVKLDDVAKELMYPGSDLNLQVASAYGDDVLDEDGAIIRPLLAERAFATDTASEALNKITQPAIEQYLTDYLVAPYCTTIRPDFCIVEYPLLATIPKLREYADVVLVIIAPYSQRVQRMFNRGMDETDALHRIAIQPTDGDYELYAHFVINNDETKEAFEARLDAWWNAHVAPKALPLD
jgi:dephospho-CoA kinase